MNSSTLFAIVFVSISIPAVAAPANLLINTDFGDGLRGWRMAGGQAHIFAADVGGAAKGVRMRVEPQPGAVPWSIALRQSVDAFMDKGDRLALLVWMRSPERCRVTPYVEIGHEPYTKSLSKTVTLTPEWKEYRVEGKCLQSFSPGEAQFGFHLGYSTGTIEIAGIRLFDLDRKADAAGARPTIAAPQSLVVNGDFSQPLKGNWGMMDGRRVKTELFPAQAGPYTKALRLTCNPARGANPWAIQLGQKCQGYVRRGDAIYFRAWLRSPDRCAVSFIYELGEPPHTKSISQKVKLSPAWQEYRFMGRALQGFRPGQSQAKFFLGYDKGVVEVAGVRVENYGAARGHVFDQTIDYWGGQAHSDAWRGPALARIEKVRKGDLTIEVVDANGRPVPDAQVRVEQKRHRFRFGSAVGADMLVNKTNPDSLRYQREVERLYNAIVFENDLKWATQSEQRLRTVEQAIEWLHARHIAVRGHCLLWGRYKHLPRPLRKLRGDALLQACKKHVADYATRMRGKVYVWDVVNEARTNTEVWDEIGWDNFANAFRWARAADPDVLLCYNDYSIVNQGRNQRQGVAKRIQYLLDHDAPVDVLGIQSHMGLPLTPLDQVLSILDEWAQFGKPLEITEFDVGCLDDKVHGQYVRDFMTAVFSHPKVESFIMWGFWEGRHWRAKVGGHMFRRDWSKRPAQDAFEDLVFNQWWTKWEGKTEADGAASLRAFYGTHQIAVQANGKRAAQTIELAPGKETKVKVVLK